MFTERAGLGHLFGYRLGLLGRKRRQPAEDVISDLLAAQASDPALIDQGIAHLSAGRCSRVTRRL